MVSVRSPLVALGLVVALSACRGEPRKEIDFTSTRSEGGSGQAREAKPMPPGLPGDQAIEGWRLTSGPETFDAKRLFEAIDGAAERFVDLGFESMVKAVYRPEGIPYHEELVVEVYRMTSPLAAFGIYQAEAEDCDRAAGGPGCARGSDRVLRKGRFFVKVTTYDDSKPAVAELARVAKWVADHLEGDDRVPEEFRVFPNGPRLRFGYLPSNQDEIPGLGRVLVGASGSWKIFVRPAKEPKADEAYAALVAEGPWKTPVAPLPDGVEGAVVKLERGFGFRLGFGGAIVVGVGFRDQAEAKKWATETIAAMKRAGR